ncbi:hypothetical protein [Acidocella sp.]|uniref:hypothetical protein n=1 Tax=Acidocella sp. TaxID=50710 RepID=UPI00260C2554|nr:hypothetical protein [Acidocella sp.]
MDFVSFWHGPVDPITYGCLASFPYHGQTLRLYAYDANLPVPPGVELADAREICPDHDLINRYFVDGKTSFSKFSNYFRYLLLRAGAGCWVDADLLCLRPPTIGHLSHIFGRQFPQGDPWEINGAVLKLPPTSPCLADLARIALEAAGLDSGWGVIGPELLTRLCYQHNLQNLAQDQAMFYPLSPDAFWRVLFPDEYESVRVATEQTQMLHLWYNNYQRSGYDKQMAPPPGSFLHRAFEKLGVLGKFSGAYDVTQLVHAIGDWLPPEKRFYGTGQAKIIADILWKLDNLGKGLAFAVEQMGAGWDCPPLLGKRWLSETGDKWEFQENGLILKNMVPEGRWFTAHGEPARIICLWGNADWIDSCHFEGDSVLRCKNQHGHEFRLTRRD